MHGLLPDKLSKAGLLNQKLTKSSRLQKSQLINRPDIALTSQLLKMTAAMRIGMKSASPDFLSSSTPEIHARRQLNRRSVREIRQTSGDFQGDSSTVQVSPPIHSGVVGKTGIPDERIGSETIRAD